MNSTQNFIKGFDLFSKPFVFFVGEKKSKSTVIGGALSLSIGIVSAIYFYYLINMYLSGSVEPKTTTSIIIETEENQIDILENFFIFEMLINGVPLNQYENSVGKKFLTYHVYYEQYDSTGACEYVDIPLIQCTDQNFLGFLCMDELAINKKNIYSYPIKKVSSDYAISVLPCDRTVTENCATDEEFYDTIFKPSNYFQIYTKIKQYNNSKRAYLDSYKSDYFYFDPMSVLYTRIGLIKASTTVIEGIIIQTSQMIESIFDFKRVDTAFSLDNIYNRMGIDGFAYIVFDLNQVHNLITVQHAMITEVLAQFMSIFNSLLTIGIIARMFAESHIVEDMNNILLKEYYKKTALRLLNHCDQKQLQQQIIKPQKIEQEDISSRTQKDDSEEKDLLQEIIQKYNKLNKANFTDQKHNYFQMSMFERSKVFIRQVLGLGLKEKGESDQGPDSIIYKKLLNQSNKRINIFEVYKDIIKLKMAIKLMLTKEQFAAIQFCGSEIYAFDPPDCIDIEQKNDKSNKYQQSESYSQKKVITSSKSSSKPSNTSMSLQQKKNKEPKVRQERKDIPGKQFLTQQILEANLFPECVKVEKSDQDTMREGKVADEQNKNQSHVYHRIKYDKNKMNSNKIEGDIDQMEDPNIYNYSEEQLEQVHTVQPNSIQTELNLHKKAMSEIYQLSHLAEMDKIEDNFAYSQKYLQLFLNNVDKNNSHLSHINKQIFQSLPFGKNDIQQRQLSSNFQNNNQPIQSVCVKLEVNRSKQISLQKYRDETNPIILNIIKQNQYISKHI